MVTNEIYNPVKVGYLFKESSDVIEAFYARVEKLPKVIGDVLFALATPQKIEQICQKFQLTENQSMYLSRIVRDVMIAKIYFGDLVEKIKSELDMPDILARKLANILVEELFRPAMEEMKKLQIEAFSDKIKEASKKGETSNVVNLRENK